MQVNRKTVLAAPLAGAIGRGVVDFVDIGRWPTFNLADEIQGALATPIELGIGAVKGTDEGKGFGRIGDAYTRGLEKARSSQRAAETQSPIANFAGQVAGGMALGGTGSRSGLTG